jgi:hypothetical protein
VRSFVKQLPPVRTEREWIRDRMLEQARGSARAQYVDRWKQDALSTWRAFRAQQQAAEQAKQRYLDRGRQLDLQRSRTHREDLTR